MHPEVKQDKPGRCPKCGMDLVEVEEKGTENSEHKRNDASAMDHTEHHRRMAEDFKRRFFIAVPLTVIVLILSPKIQEWFGFSLDFPLRNFALFALGSVIALFGGWPFYTAAKDELRARNWGMMTLVSPLRQHLFFRGKAFGGKSQPWSWHFFSDTGWRCGRF